MLPDTDYRPPRLLKASVGVGIAGDIATDLGGPELSVSPRWPVMLGAPMPEAAVDKHRHFDPGEHHIGRSAYSR